MARRLRQNPVRRPVPLYYTSLTGFPCWSPRPYSCSHPHDCNTTSVTRLLNQIPFARHRPYVCRTIAPLARHRRHVFWIRTPVAWRCWPVFWTQTPIGRRLWMDTDRRRDGQPLTLLYIVGYIRSYSRFLSALYPFFLIESIIISLLLSFYSMIFWMSCLKQHFESI